MTSKAALKSATDIPGLVVLFVLGGPGCGKGTQCALLRKEYELIHLSIGQLCRDEVDQKTKYLFSDERSEIASNLQTGGLAPPDLTIRLLKMAMMDSYQSIGITTFLVDGFPRSLDRALAFEEVVVKPTAVIYLVCEPEVMVQRVRRRAESDMINGGHEERADDVDSDAINKRVETFLHRCLPVLEHYQEQGKVVRVDAGAAKEHVFRAVLKGLKGKGILQEMRQREGIDGRTLIHATGFKEEEDEETETQAELACESHATSKPIPIPEGRKTYPELDKSHVWI